MAKWITRLPPKEKIAGSIPARDVAAFLVYFLCFFKTSSEESSEESSEAGASLRTLSKRLDGVVGYHVRLTRGRS